MFFPVELRIDIPIEEAELFNCKHAKVRAPQETKGHDYDATVGSAGECCDTQYGDTGECC